MWQSCKVGPQHLGVPAYSGLNLGKKKPKPLVNCRNSMSKRRGGLKDWLWMNILGLFLLFFKCLLIVVTLLCSLIKGKHFLTKIKKVCNTFQINHWTFQTEGSYGCTCKKCCENQAHSHRLTFIHESSSPLVTFHRTVSGKKDQQSTQKHGIIATAPGWLSGDHNLIPTQVTTLLRHHWHVGQTWFWRS